MLVFQSPLPLIICQKGAYANVAKDLRPERAFVKATVKTLLSSCCQVGNSYLIIVIFFTLTQFLENKIYTQKTRKLRQNTQKIAHFLRYYGKIHSKLPIFRVKSVKIYTCQKNLH